MSALASRDEMWAAQLRWQFGLRAPLVGVAVPTGATTIAIALTLPVGTGTYGVQVTPNWLTTVAVPVRGLTSVRVDFGTAAPAGALLDCTFFRA